GGGGVELGPGQGGPVDDGGGRGPGDRWCGLAHAEGAVDVDHGVIAEVGAGGDGDDGVVAYGRGGGGGGGLGEAEGVAVDRTGGGGGEAGVGGPIGAAGVGGRHGEGGLADGEGAVDVDDGVVAEVGSGGHRDDGVGAHGR